MKRLTRIAVALLTVLVLLPAGFAQSESVKAYVSSTTLKIYDDYTTSADVTCVLSYGEVVYCTAVKGDWARITNCDGEVGYCLVSNLTAKSPNRYDVTAYVQSDNKRIYRGASTDTDSAGLDQNAQVTVIAITGDKTWCRVKIHGIYGYIKTADLDKSKVKDSSAIQTGSVAVYVADNTLTVYTSPSTSADSATIGFGEKLTCVAVGYNWAKLKSGDKVAYCKTDGLTTENPNEYSVTVYAQSASVKVRKLPTSSAGAIASVDTNTSMTAIAVTQDGKWYRVKGGGEYGYVLASDVDTDKVSTASKTSTADKIIALAYKQMGDPYVYAAAGPNAFDCSGLTCYCFKNIAGITLERSAKGQGYDTSYTKISDIADLKKGDIVCFDTNESDEDLSDHVGIYIGGGRFIHASSSGGEVMISSLASGYYRSAFSWGRRILD